MKQPTLWSRALLDKLIVVQLFNEYLAFYGTPRFVTVLITTELSLCSSVT
jgi:hypothetical protein